MYRIILAAGALCIIQVSISYFITDEHGFTLSRLMPASLKIQRGGEPPLCSLEELGVGEWYPSNNSALESEGCCGWDGLAPGQRSTTPACAVYGNDTFVPWVTGGRGCLCKGTEDQWQYKPIAKCQIAAFDVSKLCRHTLRKHQLVFAGDSVMQQTYAVLVGIIHKADPSCLQHFAYYHSDTLTGKSYGGGNRGKSIAQVLPELIKATNLSIVVIASAGAHVVRLPQRMEMFTEAVTVTRDALNKAGIPLLWLTAPPAHPGCRGKIGLRGPIRDMYKMSPVEIDNAIFAGGRDDRYNWTYMGDFARMARDLMGGPGRVINTYTPLLSRIDGHDTHECLHYCYRGPLQLVPIVLNHMLEMNPMLLYI